MNDTKPDTNPVADWKWVRLGAPLVVLFGLMWWTSLLPLPPIDVDGVPVRIGVEDEKEEDVER